MFNYNPSDANTAWPRGEYQATVFSVKQKTSKAGNDMYEVIYECYSGAKKTQVWDYIVNPSTLFKLKALAKALGALEEFTAGTFDPEKHVGEALTLTLDVEEDEFGEKNKVKKTAPKGGATVITDPGPHPHLAPTAADVADPDVPF